MQGTLGLNVGRVLDLAVERGKRLGIAAQSKAAPVTKPLELLFQGKNRSAIKRRLLKDGALKNQCIRCGISDWQGKPLSIQIDHINGVNDDYRLENLRMPCANCHALTPTHGRRNAGKTTAAVRTHTFARG